MSYLFLYLASRTVPGTKEFVKHSMCLLNYVFYCLVWAATVTLPPGIYQIFIDQITRENKSTISLSFFSNVAVRYRKKRGVFVFCVTLYVGPIELQNPQKLH